MRLRYSNAARQDRVDVWRWNAERYGLGRADEYSRFLSDAISALKDDPESGRNVSGRPELRRLVVKRRSDAQGHIAFYTVGSDTIEIVRILHTARNWPSLLDESS